MLNIYRVGLNIIEIQRKHVSFLLISMMLLSADVREENIYPLSFGFHFKGFTFSDL